MTRETLRPLVLAALQSRPNQTPMDLAELLDREPNTIRDCLARCLKSGLVVRRRVHKTQTLPYVFRGVAYARTRSMPGFEWSCP